MKKLIVILNLYRLIIPSIFYLGGGTFRKIINKDLEKYGYSVKFNMDTYYGFLYSLVYNYSFRAIFYYRIYEHKLIKNLEMLVLPNKRDIEITGDIAPGMIIFHGQGTIIHAKKIGKNFSCYQHVTIGRNSSHDYGSESLPTIGDDVTIYTGAVVAGGIKIGNNVSIGANCVVLRDVPDNSVVIGNKCIVKNI